MRSDPSIHAGSLTPSFRSARRRASCPDEGGTYLPVRRTEALAVTGTRAVGATAVSTTLASPLAPQATSDALGAYTYVTGDAGASPAITRHVTWEDAAENTYGPLKLDGAAAVAAIPSLAVTLVDSLSADNDSNSLITEDDEIKLHATVRAGPGVGLTDVVVTLPLDAAIVTDSATASQGSVSLSTVDGVTTVTYTVGTLAANATANLEVKVLAPDAAGVDHQATAEAEVSTRCLGPDRLPGLAIVKDRVRMVR